MAVELLSGYRNSGFAAKMEDNAVKEAAAAGFQSVEKLIRLLSQSQPQSSSGFSSGSLPPPPPPPAAAEEKPKEETAPSYTYWVREKTADAAPLPIPRKLNPGDQPNNQTPTHLGSAWNRAGTWEEKSLNKWANDRIKELLVSVGSLELSGGKAEITEVTKCNGDAFLVTVRNKKRVGYTYELTLKVKGEWLVGAEKKVVKGHIEIPEFSFGELDDLQIEASLSEDKDLEPKDKQRIKQDFRLFLQPLREKLLQFEQELKER